MIKKVRMPQLSETVKEGKIVAWLKGIGEKVKEGEILFEVESDKATMEVESESNGYLRRILHQEDEEVAFGEVIALLSSTPDETIPAE